MPTDPTGRPKGFAFVQFADHASAKKALDALNGQEVDGRGLRINFSGGAPPAGGRPERPQFGGDRAGGFNARPQGGDGQADTLFVGNVSFKSSEHSIRDFFSAYGTIASVRIALNEEGRAKGFAHVQFESPDSAKKALELNG